MAKINFLEETISILCDNGKTPNDVLWVGTREHKTTWEEFASRANFIYNNGYGGEEINMDLLVVGKNFWLERHNYDGSEWWEFKSIPLEPNDETNELNLLEDSYEIINGEVSYNYGWGI